jgi:FSR family fosmidomycin resistance protein-like MFS transporter
MTDATLARADLRRDQRVIVMVGSAHFLSHFFQLALPPLFPLLHGEFGVDYATLGFLMTLFYASSGVAQAFAGILVDRLGAKRVLVAGMALMAGSIGLASLAPAYWALLPLAILAGLGNSVFHPANLSILSLKVSRHRLGRAYGIHSFLGALGYAAAAASIALMAEAFGWRTAALVAGLGGLAVTALIAATGDLLATPSHGRRSGAAGPAPIGYLQLIGNPTIVLVFVYFALTAAAGLGIQNFAAAAALQIYGISLGEAAITVTSYLILSAGGILLGGWLADRTGRHDATAIVGTVAAGALLIVASFGGLGLPVLAAVIGLSGFCAGVTGPSRDMLVRGLIPAGSTGKVFGFVYCGGDAGATLTPVLFGFLLDHAMPNAVFLASAVLLLVSVVTLLRFAGPSTR